MIEIRIVVPAELQNSDWVESFASELRERYNSDWFDQKQRTIICLHEAAHLVYTRMAGFEPRLFGPAVKYDDLNDELFESVSSVGNLPDEIAMNADSLLVAKSMMGPAYVEEKLLAHRTFEEIWDFSRYDYRDFCVWLHKRNRLRGDIPRNLNVRRAVLKDLRSPAFRRKLWNAAWEFEARVFGPEGVASRKAA